MVRCLETRMRSDGIKSRRYQLADGRRVTMLELPATVIKSVGLKRVQEYMQIWIRAEKARKQTTARRRLIESMLRQRVKPLAIAHEVGVTEARVRQIRKEMGL